VNTDTEAIMAERPNDLPGMMACAGCGSTIEFSDPGFNEWWVKHGRCLRRKYDPEPPSEMDERVRQLLTDRHTGEPD
jgi:hypothetical protein